MRKIATSLATMLTLGLATGSAFAATCQNGGSFEGWLASFKKEAVAQGISATTVASALDGVTFDQSVINADRGQAVFAQSFLQFSDRMIAKYRLEKGRALIKKYKAVFDKIQQKYGVPAPVIVAFWGLETDFGGNLGDKQTLRSLATLAYDCRRPDKFREELMGALEIVQHGYLTPQEMRGPWAGELGQTQFLATNYVKYGVDFDGDGRVNLLTSVPDVLASTANYIDGLGWQKGQPWLQEVRVPADLPWDQAELSIKHPRSQWVKWGVKGVGGAALPADSAPASLILPMGRKGPAFLGYANFDVYLEWNESLTYSLTAAYFATRLAGAPALSRGDAPATLTLAQGKQLQQSLSKLGYDVGKVDGIIGASTRKAVKAMQIKFGLPADSYPTAELLARLQ